MTITTREEARAAMQRAIEEGDMSSLEPHVRRATTESMHEAFAIIRGSAGVDMSLPQRFLACMLTKRLLTLDDVAEFAKQLHRPAEGARAPA